MNKLRKNSIIACLMGCLFLYSQSVLAVDIRSIPGQAKPSTTNSVQKSSSVAVPSKSRTLVRNKKVESAIKLIPGETVVRKYGNYPENMARRARLINAKMKKSVPKEWVNITVRPVKSVMKDRAGKVLLDNRQKPRTKTIVNLTLKTTKQLQPGEYLLLLQDNKGKAIRSKNRATGKWVAVAPKKVTVLSRSNNTVTQRQTGKPGVKGVVRVQERLAGRSISQLGSRVGVRDFSSAGNCTVTNDASLPLPRVTSWGPQSGGYKGLKITFNGTNFISDKFCVRFGSQYLEVVTREDSRIEALLPAQRGSGVLVVSHGTTDSEFVVSENYHVAGDPIINSVVPLAFRYGEIVTITGSDLKGLIIPRIREDSLSWMIKIANDNQEHNGDARFLKITELSINEAGTSMTFRAADVYEGYLYSPSPDDYSVLRLRVASEQPAVLSGNIRFISPGGSFSRFNEVLAGSTSGTTYFDFIGPGVTWRPALLSLSQVKPPRWGELYPDFIIAGADPYSNRVTLEGTGLYGATAKVGSRDVNKAFSYHGLDGWITFEMSTPSDYIELHKEGSTVRSTEPLIIIPEPDVLKPSNVSGGNVWVLPLNQDIQLSGWDLKPASVSGLIYRLELSGLYQMNNMLSSPSCNLNVELLSHTNNRITFRVNTTGVVSESCLNSSLFGSGTGNYLIRIVANFNNIDRELWKHAYYLASP